MAHFPIFIDVKKQPCLVVGGGQVAYRKIKILLRYGADVRVVAKDVCEEIRSCLPESSIRLGQVTEAEIQEASLVIVATGSWEVNHETAMLCRRCRVPVNVVDAPEECTFFFPSVVKKGDISIGINTGGRSPLVSKQIRKDIERTVPDYYAEIVMQMGELRTYLRENVPEENKRRNILQRVAGEAFAGEGMIPGGKIEEIIRQETEG